jgi:hypothetical protein
MTFRAAQDHNKAVGRDMTSSTPSSTQWEVPAATTWHHSFSFAFAYRELYCLEFLTDCFSFYWRELECLAAVYIFLYILPILEAHHLVR